MRIISYLMYLHMYADMYVFTVCLLEDLLYLSILLLYDTKRHFVFYQGHTDPQFM